jgi:uncharacterized protein
MILMAMTETVAVWALTSCLFTIGLLGSVVPFLPGPLIILIGGISHVLLLPASGAGWWGVALLAVLTLVAYAIDMVSGVMGAKWFGASKWGIAGVLVGGLVGLFFGLPGWILGPLIGGLVFELALAKRDFSAAMKGSWGTVLGSGVGILARLVTAVLMVTAFLVDVFVW